MWAHPIREHVPPQVKEVATAEREGRTAEEAGEEEAKSGGAAADKTEEKPKEVRGSGGMDTTTKHTYPQDRTS